MYRVLIFSSKEALEVAKAVHANLRAEGVDAEIWIHGMFKSSLSSRLDQLVEAISEAAAGVVVLNPDDKLISRGVETPCPRDNCIFELGLLIGLLGKKSVYWIKEESAHLRVPSDLTGLDPIPYTWSKNLISSTSPACTQIATGIKSRTNPDLPVRADSYERLFGWIGNQLIQSDSASFLFIHARRFCDSYTTELDDLLNRPSGKMEVFLPDLKNRTLMQSIQGRFEDGDLIPGLVKQTFKTFRNKKAVYGGRLKIYTYQTQPTFSLYAFDHYLLHASYPLTVKKKPVPAVVAPNESKFGQATLKLFADLREESCAVAGPDGFSVDSIDNDYLI